MSVSLLFCYCPIDAEHVAYTSVCVLMHVIGFILLSQHHEQMDNSDHQRSVMQLSVAMGNLTVVLKGEQDLITDGSKGLYKAHIE